MNVLFPLFPQMHRSRCLLTVLGTLLLCFPLLSSRQPAQASPTQVRLRGHIPAADIARAHPMGRVPRNETLSLVLALPVRDSAGLETLLNRLYEPSDPLYHQYLTPEEFTQRFAPTPQSYEAVIAFARSRGLTVTRTYPNRLLVSVSGSAATVESAFSVHLRRYAAADGRVFHAPDADPAIPFTMIGRLSGVIGLDNAHLRHPYLHRRGPAPHSILKQTGAEVQAPAGVGTDPYTGQSALTPSDIKAAYNLNKTSLTGAGQTLALFELDTYTPSDIAAYEAAFGLPSVPLVNVPVDPSNPNFPSSPGGGAGEVTLDIEVMAAVAPGASKILVYESSNTDTGLVAQYNQIATDDLAKEISSSWGLAENAIGQATRDAENTAFQQMAAQGQSIFCASGDSGAYDDNATISVDDPASQPFMVGVGGTTLSVVSPGGAYKTESAWNNRSDTRRSPFGAGGGGGISTVWPLPDYQTGVGQSSTQRNVPDVSLDADTNTGYAIYFSDPNFPGQPWNEYGGTSVASPIWAAFTALANQQRVKYGEKPVGFANRLIYTIGKSANYSTTFHDVADGSTNLFYSTKPGYDNATGWGSFNGVNLLAVFAPPPNTSGNPVASLTLTPNPVVGGLTVNGTVTLTNPAPSGGAAVALTTTDATTAPVPSTVFVAAGATSASFTITTAVSTGTTVTITASYAGGGQMRGLVVLPSPIAVIPLSLSFNPDSVNGGDSSTATVTLTGAAPKAGLSVTLASSDPAAQVPATVTVPAGTVSATFTVTTTQVLKQVVANISATANGGKITAPLTVLAPTLEKLVLTPPNLPGGQTATGTLNLTFAAPAGGAVVTLSSDNVAAQVPATVTIPASGLTTTFTVTTSAVPQTVIATITATYAGLSQTAKLAIQSARILNVAVTPASLTGGSPDTGTVTLDSAAVVDGGLTVTLSGSSTAATLPASVTVPKGANTATFPITTTVVPAPIADTITASLDSRFKTTLLTIQPIEATNLTLSPSQVISGIASVGTVTVNAAAPAGGLAVALSSSDGAATVPASVLVSAGATTVTFPIATPTPGIATISAIVGGQTRTASLTVTVAPGTSYPAGLNMISAPYDYSGQALDALFGYSGVKLAAWLPEAAAYAVTPNPPADAMRLGRGYWVRLPKAVTLAHAGTPADPTADFSISLSTGWNMIGDPFLVPISLGVVRVSAGGATSTFSQATSTSPLLLSELVYSYSQTAAAKKGGYVWTRGDGSLQPGLGYWIYAYQPVTLVIPHPGQ